MLLDNKNINEVLTEYFGAQVEVLKCVTCIVGYDKYEIGIDLDTCSCKVLFNISFLHNNKIVVESAKSVCAYKDILTALEHCKRDIRKMITSGLGYQYLF